MNKENLPTNLNYREHSLSNIQYGNINNSNNNFNDDDIDILSHIRVLNKYRGLIISITVFCILIGLVYSFVATPKYSAYSTIQIENYEPVLMSGNIEEMLKRGTKDQKYLETKIEEITSLSVADLVLNDSKILRSIEKNFEKKSFLSIFNFFGASDENVSQTSKYKHKVKYLKSYLEKVSIQPIRKTTLIQLHVLSNEPTLSEYMANKHAQAYIDWVRDNRVERQARGLKFLTQEKSKIKRKISVIEREMADYAEENSIVAVNENENVVMNKVSQLNEMLVKATRKRIESEKMFEQAMSAKDEGIAAFDDKTIQELRAQLATLESKRSQLLNKYTSNYPKVKEISAEISGLTSAITNHEKKLLRGLKIKAASALEEEQNLKEELEQQESKAFELSKKQVKYNSLKRDADTQRELLKNISNQIEETSLAVESDASNLSIVDFATTPLKPKYPRKKFVLVISALFGLISGISLALIINIFDNKIHTPEEIESVLQLPNLGVVPKFEETDRNANQKLIGNNVEKPKPNIDENLDEVLSKDLEAQEKSGSIVPHGTDSDLEIEIEFIKQPMSLASEAYRTIRTGILLSQAGEPPKTIMFTSAQSSEGKTTLASNIAASLASSGAQVVVIDCDLRRPSITKVFNSSTSDIGLSEILTGQCELGEAIQKNILPNIHLIPCGKIPPNPAELLGSVKMKELLIDLERTFDYVIIDTPPVLPVTDAVLLSKLVDGVMFVVRGELTPKKVAQDAKNKLLSVSARVLGTVLNNVDIKKRAYGYYNKYHYAYYEQEERV